MNTTPLRAATPAKRLTIRLPLCFPLLIAAALALTAVMFWLQPNAMAEKFTCLADSGGLVFLLNFLPILLCMFFLFFAVGSLSAAVGVTGFAVVAMSVVNRFKMVFRHDPFKPWDILLGGELMGISKSFSPKLIGGTAALVLLMLLALCLALVFVRNEKMRIGVKIAGAAATAVLFGFCNAGLLSATGINNSLPVIGNVYNQVDQYNSKGFLYQFIYTFNHSKIAAPLLYDKAEFQASRTEPPAQTAAGKLPHVFLILGEGFSDIPLSPVLSYGGFQDPTARYREIRAESDAGRLIAPNIGGGTADTEFDILTGVNTRQFRGAPYSNLLVTKPMDALPWVLKENGYKTAAVHPGHAWFYNRQNVFAFLGFDSFTSVKSFDEANNKSMYMSEAATYDRVLEGFYSHVAQTGGQPLFSFVITIQNHGPYEDKYGTDAETNFRSAVPFGSSDTNALSNYLLGMADMDRELGRLVDEMRACDEPVVVAYFGDHLPLLSQDVYDALVPGAADSGAGEGLRLCRVPWIIWANDAARALPNLGQTEKKPHESVSSFYFGAMLLDYLGLGQADPFFAYLNELRDLAPVILENEYAGPEVAFRLKTEPSATGEEVARYERWSYFRLFEGRQ